VVSKKWGEVGLGASEKGEGVVKKVSNARLNPPPALYFWHSLALSFSSRGFKKTLATQASSQLN